MWCIYIYIYINIQDSEADSWKRAENDFNQKNEPTLRPHGVAKGFPWKKSLTRSPTVAAASRALSIAFVTWSCIIFLNSRTLSNYFYFISEFSFLTHWNSAALTYAARDRCVATALMALPKGTRKVHKRQSRKTSPHILAFIHSIGENRWENRWELFRILNS